MADNVDKETRSRIMARVGGKNTVPEIALRKAIFCQGFRYRLHVSALPGKPDIVLPRYRAAIFINGCFWHWHGCRHSRLPSSNVAYWEVKIGRNRERDQVNYAKLLSDGWRVLIIWECALKKSNITEAACLTRDYLNGDDIFCVIESKKEGSQITLSCKSQPASA